MNRKNFWRYVVGFTGYSDRHAPEEIINANAITRATLLVSAGILPAGLDILAETIYRSPFQGSAR